MKSRRNIIGWQLLLLLLITPLMTTAVEAATGTVNYNTVYQQLEGFGGAAVYDCYNLTVHPEREKIYDRLFKELGIEILRIRNCYGYDSTSVSRTKTIIAEARKPQRSPNLKLEMVPWSPPGGLKSGGTIKGGTLAGGPSSYVYDDYADWWHESLVNWASGDNGITPDFISIQNEPDCNNTSYDTCIFNPTEDSHVAGYDQAFEAVYNKLYAEMGSSMPEMWAPCTMGFGGSVAYIEALDDIEQLDNVDGFSHHLYTDGSYDNPDDMIEEPGYTMQEYAADYGYKPLHMTEYVRLNTTPNFDMAWKFAWHIYNCLYYLHSTSYFNWTLFRYGSPSSGGIVTMDSPSTFIIRPQYWYLKAYARYTDKDWYVLGTSVSGTTNLRMSAFKNPENSELTVVILNISTGSISLTSLTLNNFVVDSSEVYQSKEDDYWVSLGAFSGSLTLPARSITTIHMTGAPGFSDCDGVLDAGYGLESDLSGDCYVNYEDLDYISYYWLNTDCVAFDDCDGADFEPDGDVDLIDYSVFAEQWMWCNDPTDPNCTPNW